MSTKLKTIMISIALALCAAWLWMHRYDYRTTPRPNIYQRINRITGEIVQIKSEWAPTTTTTSSTTTTQPRCTDVDKHGFWIPPTKK